MVGLSDQEVVDSRREYGWNILTPPKRQSLWQLYIEKYKDPIIEILLVAAAVSLVLAVIEHEYVETIGIFLAIFLATTVGFFFELDAARKFDVLTQLNEEQRVKVIRNGQVQLIARKEIVVGDVVIIETGDEIPADGILNDANSLQVDESMLTGEPLSTKDASPTPSATAFPRNMVLRSTMVMNGRGRVVVTAVGDDTEIGKVARTSSENANVKTPLNLQLDRLGKFINKFGFTLSILAAVLFLIHDMLVNDSVWGPLWGVLGSSGYIVPSGEGWGDAILPMASTVLKYFMMAVTLIVMAVPEGLPMAVTLSLALNMRRMLKSNNLVRKLHACETMGAVTVICTDKTGTLTQNRMQVAEMAMGTDGKNLESLYEAIAVNTTAELVAPAALGPTDGAQAPAVGFNPTEVALLTWLNARGIDYRQLRADAQITDQEPFSTETKMMSTTVCRADGSRTEYIKGAPEIILRRCNLTDTERQSVDRELLSYQQKAMRTLAFAMRQLPAATQGGSERDTDDTPFTYQTVVAIADPLRPDVAGAVRQCNDAGIEVKIVTGDVDATAMEIARQVGILSDSHPGASISGAEFAALSDEEAVERVKDLVVMSRARPSDKQRLVQLLQRRGEVVAVTGDGTNDAPALNYAHVGLSLGSGTNVAKEASDMTLLDDSFGSIARAVMWGRSLYRNIQRFLFFQLVVNVVALLLVIAGSLVGTEMPLTVTQILWVNLIMDTFAAMALSSLPPSREVMADKPRKQTEFILSRSIIRGILLSGILMFAVMFVFLLYCEHGIDLGTRDTNLAGIDTRELTWFFTTFVMMQWWNLFNAKCIGSHHSAFRRLWAAKGFVLVLLCILAGQWLIVQFGGEMFRCVPLSAREWAVIIAATSPVVIIGEIYRRVSR